MAQRGRPPAIHDGNRPLLLRMIERGVAPTQAARAVGIRPATWQRYMARGRDAKSGPYREFYESVLFAQGKAVAIAETRVWEESPLHWLRYGPVARHRPHEPGWGDLIEKEKPEDEQAAERGALIDFMAHVQKRAGAGSLSS